MTSEIAPCACEQKEHVANARFCSNCGRGIARCGNCQFFLRNDRFCPMCGTPHQMPEETHQQTPPQRRNVETRTNATTQEPNEKQGPKLTQTSTQTATLTATPKRIQSKVNDEVEAKQTKHREMLMRDTITAVSVALESDGISRNHMHALNLVLRFAFSDRVVVLKPILPYFYPNCEVALYLDDLKIPQTDILAVLNGLK